MQGRAEKFSRATSPGTSQVHHMFRLCCCRALNPVHVMLTRTLHLSPLPLLESHSPGLAVLPCDHCWVRSFTIHCIVQCLWILQVCACPLLNSSISEWPPTSISSYTPVVWFHLLDRQASTRYLYSTIFTLSPEFDLTTFSLEYLGANEKKLKNWVFRN